MSNLASIPMQDYINICDKIREKTETTEVIKSGEIKDKIPLIFSNGQLDAVQSSEVLKGSLSAASVVSAKDVSPYTHNIDCFLTSKNLLPFPYLEGSKKTKGVTFTVNSDGTVTANGTATADADFIVRSGELGLIYENEQATYRLTGCPSGGSADTYFMQVYYGNRDIGNGLTLGYDTGNTNASLIRIIIKSGYTAENLVFKPMIFKGTGTTPYALRVKDFSGIVLKVGASAEDENAQIFTCNADGTVNGEITSIYPEMVISTDNIGVVVNADYTKDIDATFNALSTAIAMSGGE